MSKTKTILVAPLNWGLGHAARCIPVIDALLDEGFEVLLGSDGAALFLLRKQYPKLKYVELPSYQIEYTQKNHGLKWKLFLRSPKIIRAVIKERKLIIKLVKSGEIDGVISDNRLGLYHKQIPTVYMTHQLQVLSGRTTTFTTAVHQAFIKRYDACWVPDFKDGQTLSGKLGHPAKLDFPVTYIGPLSALSAATAQTPAEKNTFVYDLMVLLSGPEPQRTILEELLMDELRKYEGTILLVQGVMEEEQHLKQQGHIQIVNFMQAHELERAINDSALILCRSGYSSIMGLAKLGNKVFFIPTPGQYEQEYLAKYLDKMGIAPFAAQHAFNVEQLKRQENYSGFVGSAAATIEGSFDLREAFGLFKGERKL